MQHDVIVIGAGLAGLMAGIRAAEAGLSVVVLERNAQPCTRYLESGSGAAPVSNSELDVSRFHGRYPRFVSDALNAFDLPKLRQWFEHRGVMLEDTEFYGHIVAQGGGEAVCGALVAALDQAGASLALSSAATHVAIVDEGFAADARDQLFMARRLILAGGSGARLAEAFGHDVTPLFPALATITVAEHAMRDLDGLWMDVRLTLLSRGRAIVERTGGLQFTASGLSGEVAFNVSREVAPRLARGEQLELLVDFYPGMPNEEVEQWLHRTLGGATRERAASALDAMLPQRLAEVFLRDLKVKPNARSRDLEKPDREGLFERMKATRLTVSGTGGMDVAEGVTGGVNVRQVDPRTFESKVQPGLFIVGGMLDIGGDWGGFEQHFALASGWVAGMAAASAR